MKRRSFLGLIGAALTTPALPATGAGAGYTRTSYGMAVLHARTRHHVSARGLAHCLKVPMSQAKAMMAEMTSTGLIQPIANGAGVHFRAMSNILQPSAIGLRTADDLVKRREDEQMNRPARGNNLNAFMAHLHHMCVDRGITLNPRCAMQYGIST